MPNAVAEGLRRRGYEVTTSAQVGLISAADIEQLAFAARECRVLITRDQDFLRLSAQGHEHAGIIYWTERQRALGPFIRAVDALCIDFSQEDFRGKIVFL
jgi:hypothetical protein